MAIERTLCIIKPDAVKARKQGAILQRILDAGFSVLAMSQLSLSKELASKFYAVHRERSFFGELVDFMTSGPVVVVALEGENAISRYRELIGATDPAKAAPGTVRRDFGASIEANAIHGSDSAANGLIETAFFFPGCQL
ncbi:MAG TPA: nucleoside-diphosphate kinase [Polyangiaceae bacterium]|jgi:nucleoside-diphosphate kinase|nr:nucleoside-diphosphate kinase [Polyangiaceae bacterium]